MNQLFKKFDPPAHGIVGLRAKLDRPKSLWKHQSFAFVATVTVMVSGLLVMKQIEEQENFDQFLKGSVYTQVALGSQAPPRPQVSVPANSKVRSLGRLGNNPEVTVYWFASSPNLKMPQE